MSQVNDNNQIHRLRHAAFVYSFLCIYIILFHLSTTSMPPKPPKSPSKKATAKWNVAETEALITFLRSESTRIGCTSFKEASFTTAADHIKELHTEGAIKTAAHCKTKWTSVRFLINDKLITNYLTFFYPVESEIQHSRTSCLKLRCRL